MKTFVDFDGTLSSGYISMDFMDFLFDKHLYHAKSYSGQQSALNAYKAGTLSYDEWCKSWGELWAEGMKCQNAAKIDASAQEFFKDYKKNIYPTSYDIINFLKEKSDVVLLSVGAYEMASLAAKDLGIEHVLSTELERNGSYTGRILTGLHLPDGKQKILKSIDDAPYIGLGDSLGDAGFLSIVKVPIVMNPNAEMKNYAAKNGWPCQYSDNSSQYILHGIRMAITDAEAKLNRN